MGTKSKFFRAFVEGNTISDGRTITAAMIDEIVATFNRDTYSPRINVEHIAGYSPEPPFNGYGDVYAVKAQDDDITVAGKTEKRRALYVQVDANDQLLNLAATDQKPYPSVELTPSYAGCGKTGIVGLAFTDNPASIATQRLQFSRSAPGTFHAHGAEAVALEFDAAPIDVTKPDGAIANFFNTLASKFGRPVEEKPKEEPKPKPQPANDNAFDAGNFATEVGKTVAQSIAAAMKPVTDAHAKLAEDFSALQAKLEKAPVDTFSRPPATGGSTAVLTDC
ncbi:GPO family capsid scaffolding protein [Sphingomonas sanguinis]|uniref:GPO family capsid scaffolding protein n=1 Tax=Sphingomonas sanguinis TaxID=33051 RepID=UPI001C5A4CC9|nr:GPO family capsid scaffolding protein [Sphingomonas sanguinis]QXT36830.1 GPO family capsid scaffolding protein [Sphingomonas sanguinis]